LNLVFVSQIDGFDLVRGGRREGWGEPAKKTLWLIVDVV